MAGQKDWLPLRYRREAGFGRWLALNRPIAIGDDATFDHRRLTRWHRAATDANKRRDAAQRVRARFRNAASVPRRQRALHGNET